MSTTYKFTTTGTPSAFMVTQQRPGALGVGMQKAAMRGLTVAYGTVLILVFLVQHPPRWAEVIQISGDRSVGFMGHTLSVSIAPAARESNDLGLLRGGEPFPSCEWKPTTLLTVSPRFVWPEDFGSTEQRGGQP